MDCPNGHGEMARRSAVEEVVFRGVSLRPVTEHFVCSECGGAIDDLPLAAKNQKALSDAYRKAVGLLTGKEIAEKRKRKGWTQEQLARAINIGVAGIKRWETGQIQTKVMDDALRRAFVDDVQSSNPYTGNRELSLTRIKLALQEFGSRLGRRFLFKGDRLLYGAKYLWYCDMAAYRDLGRSITGATYARLPQGPQLNNYIDLIPLIRESDASTAEPLTEEEIRIINRIASTFPTNRSVYTASHLESSWRDRKDGELIPYSDAETIKGV